MNIALLAKAATDSKTGQWLETNLKLIPKVISNMYQNSAQNGSRVLSCHISFDGYDNMTTRVKQYIQNPKANLYFCDKRFFHGVMLTGTMEVLEDSKHKEMLWRESDTIYYHLGVSDPDYCVVKFTATKGRFYSNFKSESFEIE